MTTSCHFCGEPVDPLARDTFRRVVGWEKKALAESRKGGSDIVLRETVDEFAHGLCILRAKQGVAVGQASLL
jgi:hypothetical protein